MFRELYYAFSLIRRETIVHRTHPLLKFLGLVILFIAATFSNLELLTIILVIDIIEASLSRALDTLYRTIRALLLPIALIGFFATILYNVYRALEIVFRIIGVSWAVAIFAATTSPSEFSVALEKLGFPLKLVIIPELSFKVIPYVARDIQQTLEALTLRKEIATARPFPRGISKALAVIILSTIKRGHALAEALLAKFYGFAPKRTNIYDYGVTVYGVLQLIIKASLILLLILLH